MSLFMLDTDISSYLIRGDHPEVIEEFSKNFKKVCISAITAGELQYGALKRNNPGLTKKIQAFCEIVQIVEWNSAAAIYYAKIRNDLEKAGTPIGNMDMLIAASAMAENAILITNNSLHFSRIQNLKLDNWVKE